MNENQISYSEFIIGALDPEKHLNRTNVFALFKYLDYFEQDFLNADSIKMVFNRGGRLLSNQNIQKWFYEVENIIGNPNS